MQLSQKAPDMVDLQLLQFDSPREIHQYLEIVGITFAGEGRQSPRSGEVGEIGGDESGLPLSGDSDGTIQTG